MRRRSKLADHRITAKVADDAPPIVLPDKMMDFLVPTIDGNALFGVNRGCPESTCARDFGNETVGRPHNSNGRKSVNVGDEVIMV